MDPANTLIRCAWCSDDPDYRHYHDTEWGVPVRDEQAMFEFLILEGAQAGLSWLTVLKKRPRYRQVFHQFDPERVARITPAGVNRLLQDSGIIRNRLKVEATISNARACLELQQSGISLVEHLWSFTDGQVIRNHWQRLDQVPASTVESEAMSRDLKQRGFRFVGPTICYALMQAAGLVNDHTTDCFRHAGLNQ